MADNKPTEEQSKANDEDSTLSLSLTPPCLDSLEAEERKKTEASQENSSISEHLSLDQNSDENDRSLHEIEVSNHLNSLSFVIQNLPYEEGVEPLENVTLNSSFKSDSSVISLKCLERFIDANREYGEVRQILEDILDNEQFQSDTNAQFIDQNMEKFNLITDVNETSFTDAEKQIKHLEELISLKDHTIHALNCEVDSLKDIMSNTFSLGTSTTEYKQFQEELQIKVLEYNTAIENKEKRIAQLNELLKESNKTQEELKLQSEALEKQIRELQKQIKLSQEFKFENESLKLRETLNNDQILLFNTFELSLNIFVDQKLEQARLENESKIQELKDLLDQEKSVKKDNFDSLKELVSNSSDLVALKKELEIKHSKEMEDLRTYFEQKCADLEKNFSEDIFSQQSRKLSVSSSGTEFSGDILENSHSPGPGGDAPLSKIKKLTSMTKNDLIKIITDCQNLLKITENLDFDEISLEKFYDLKMELENLGLAELCFKIDAGSKTDKYLTEIKNIKDDYENKINLIEIEHENVLKSLENRYSDEVDNLRQILSQTNKNLMGTTTVQEIGSGEFEISEVVQSYERRLQEQVTLAKIDIIAALESQIQILASNDPNDEDWPPELLVLKDKFEQKYQQQIANLENQHIQEINVLKEEHLRALNGAIERARRRSLQSLENLTQFDSKITEERDNLKKQTGLLRNLLGELIKYFTKCEDEVNNTLVEELLKHGLEKNLAFSETEKDVNTSNSTTSSQSETANIKRVHLTPSFKELMNIIDNSGADFDTIDSSDLKTELSVCLEKLKFEANAILALTTNLPPNEQNKTEKGSLDEKITSLTRQIITERQDKNDLQEELLEAREIIKSLEDERFLLENQLEQIIDKLNVTQKDLEEARFKISTLIENGHKEVVSEGFGSNYDLNLQEKVDSEKSFNELQLKAKNITQDSSTILDPNVLQIIDDLCKLAEKIIDESKKDKEDLRKQIEVADKKYRTTCKFLEEQALEREQERDDAQKEINNLKESLKDREKDKIACGIMNAEVENLESQLREMSKNLETFEKKYLEADIEKTEAIDKIYFLREVIRELESQVKTKSETESELRNIISELECIISKENTSSEDERPNDSKDSIRTVSDVVALQKHINHLEAKVQRLKLGQELVGSEGALKEVKNQLIEFESTLDRRTKELEDLHSGISTNSCSSPSEDMSIRDVIRPQTPNSLALSECEVPLQQLARLKEKLVRHSRAEDAALKRIRDFEMQVMNLKGHLEECYMERDMLKKEISDQVTLISSLQIRLDEQRLRAEHVETQTNTSLESRIYDLQKLTNDLQDQLCSKDKQLAQMSKIMEETRLKLNEREREMESSSDDDILIAMQKEIDHLRTQNNLLHKRINSGAEIIPNLVENIISDKNSDIEALRTKLIETEKQLEFYTSLSLDKTELSALKNLSKGHNITEILSFMELSSPEQVRRSNTAHESSLGMGQIFPKKQNETATYMEDGSEISSIEKCGINKHFLTMTPILNQKPNSTEKSMERHVHFETDPIDSSKIISLERELTEKNEILNECNQKIQQLMKLENNIDILQNKLEETQVTLQNVTQKFEEQLTEYKNNEKELKVKLVERKIKTEEQEKIIDGLNIDSARKDSMYLELAKECKDLKKQIEELNHKLNSVTENPKAENLEAIKELDKLKNDLDEKVSLSNVLQEKISNMELELATEKNNNSKLQKEIQNNAEQLLENKEQILKLEKILVEKQEEFVQFQNLLQDQNAQILDKNCELEILKEDAKKYLDEITTLENQLKQTNLQKDDFSKKETQLIDLKNRVIQSQNEISHLHELLKEKDKIICQFKEDSRSLHVNLETIQNKMQETGNIVDLSKKLREEQIRNTQLVHEIHSLKTKLLAQNNSMVTSIDEIAGKVREELDKSENLDQSLLFKINSLNSIEDETDFNGLQEKYNELQQNFQKLQKTCHNLQQALEKEKFNLNTIQLEDGHLIEQLRIQLDRANINEEELEKILQNEKEFSKNLELQVAALKNQLSKTTSSKSESTEYKNLPPKEPKELIALRKDIASLKTEIESISKENKSFKKTRSEYEANLNYTKDLLNLKNNEIQNLQQKLDTYAKNEEILRKKIADISEKLTAKTNELSQNKIQLDLAENEKLDLKNQIKNLHERFSEITTENPNISLSIPDKLLRKINELNSAVKDNKKTMDLVIKLTNEKKVLTNKINDLECKIANSNVCQEVFPTDKISFAKYLRSESYRKALVWQKRYLINLLITYQEVPLLENIVPNFTYQSNRISNSKLVGKDKFRCAVHCVVSIIRMKYLVRRWRSGKRVAEALNTKYANIENKPGSNLNTIAHFQLGQPVSRQFTSASGNDRSNNASAQAQTRSDGRGSDLPWFGASPPSKDKNVHPRLGSSDTRLKAPELITKYVDRFNQIQESLDLLLNQNSNQS